MKKLREFRGEEALDVLADIIEPAAEIMQDKEIVTLFRSGDRAKAVSVALKNHKRSVLSIMAMLDGKDIETYAPSVFALPIKLLEIFNDPELVSLFTSQGQTEAPTNSGSASASTEASAE